MFRGNVEHRGIFEAAGVPKFSKMKWSFRTGGMVIGSPTVTGGVVYVGSDDGNFYAIDQGTGAQKWKFAANVLRERRWKCLRADVNDLAEI